MRLLVVDDDVELVRALRRILESWGMEANGAYDGLQALRALEIQTYDGMVLGMTMPRMDGTELIRMLRHCGVRLPIVGMTGNPDMRCSALKEGLKVCLLKPFGRDKLDEGMRQVGILHGTVPLQQSH